MQKTPRSGLSKLVTIFSLKYYRFLNFKSVTLQRSILNLSTFWKIEENKSHSENMKIKIQEKVKNKFSHNFHQLKEYWHNVESSLSESSMLPEHAMMSYVIFYV